LALFGTTEVMPCYKAPEAELFGALVQFLFLLIGELPKPMTLAGMTARFWRWGS